MENTATVTISKRVISQGSEVSDSLRNSVSEETDEYSSHRLLSIIDDKVDPLCDEVVLCVVLSELSLLSGFLFNVHTATLKVPFIEGACHSIPCVHITDHASTHVLPL